MHDNLLLSSALRLVVQSEAPRKELTVWYILMSWFCNRHWLLVSVQLCWSGGIGYPRVMQSTSKMAKWCCAFHSFLSLKSSMLPACRWGSTIRSQLCDQRQLLKCQLVQHQWPGSHQPRHLGPKLPGLLQRLRRGPRHRHRHRGKQQWFL